MSRQQVLLFGLLVLVEGPARVVDSRGRATRLAEASASPNRSGARGARPHQGTVMGATTRGTIGRNAGPGQETPSLTSCSRV